MHHLATNLGIGLQIQGHPERPRLAVYRSNLHIYAQVRCEAYRRRVVMNAQHMAVAPALRNLWHRAGACPQVIDDSIGNTLCATSTLSPDIRDQLNGKLGADKVGQGGIQEDWPLTRASCINVILPTHHRCPCERRAEMCHPCVIQGAAELVGKRIGELCLEKNISKVSFDRGGNIYHGRVQVPFPIPKTFTLCTCCQQCHVSVVSYERQSCPVQLLA